MIHLLLAHRPGFAVPLALLAIAVVAAQRGTETAPSQQQPPQPLFRSSTQYVSVDVVVTAGDDVPVTDLRREDFEITEAGRPQRIADFAFVSIPIAHRTVDVDAPPLPPSDIASNGESARATRAIVIFVDDPSLSEVLICVDCVDVMVALKEALTRFLRSLTPDDEVALVWASRSDISQDFTTDISRLIAAVNNRKNGMGIMGTTQNSGPKWRRTIDSLNFTIAALAGSHYARRAIVYVGAKACDPTDMTTDQYVECQTMYRNARAADVAIYALDPRVNPLGVGEATTATMAELAVNTGGLHFSHQSNPTGAVDKILTDNGSFYTLGFYPEPVVNDGKYHDIKVTVKRSGVRVRSRQGYVADTSVKTPTTPNREMTKALGAGLDDPSLPIRAFVAPLVPSGRATRSLVTVELDYPVPAGERRGLEDELRVGILALTPDGKIQASFQRPIRFTGTWKPTARGTFVINEVIDLPPQALKLRVGITSTALGKSGTAHIDVNVPRYDTSELQLSPIVLGSSSDAPDAATGLDTIRPLVPFQPTTLRTFSVGETLRAFGRVYWRTNATNIDAELTVTGPTAVAPQHRSVKGEIPTLGHREAAMDFTVPLSGLAPGSYVLRLDTRLSKDKSSWREILFVVK